MPFDKNKEFGITGLFNLNYDVFSNKLSYLGNHFLEIGPGANFNTISRLKQNNKKISVLDNFIIGNKSPTHRKPVLCSISPYPNVDNFLYGDLFLADGKTVKLVPGIDVIYSVGAIGCQVGNFTVDRTGDLKKIPESVEKIDLFKPEHIVLIPPRYCSVSNPKKISLTDFVWDSKIQNKLVEELKKKNYSVECGFCSLEDLLDFAKEKYGKFRKYNSISENFDKTKEFLEEKIGNAIISVIHAKK